MSASTRLLLGLFRALPLIIVVVVAGLLVFGGRTSRNELAEQADFVDRDEFGRITSLTFEGEYPDLRQLHSVPGLWRLTLKDAMLDDKAFRRIAELRGLVSLSLEGCRLHGDQLRLIEELQELRELNLSRTPDVRDGLAQLRLPNLRTLRLNQCEWVDDDALACISQFSALTGIELTATSVTDAGIKHLASLPDLQSLMLHDCTGVGDGTLDALRNRPSIRSVVMPSDRLSLAAAERFQQSSTNAHLVAPLRGFRELKELMRLSPSYDALWDNEGEFNMGFYSNGLPSVTLHNENEAADFSVLALVPQLKRLTLSGPAISDEVLQHVGNVEALEHLDLNGTAISGGGLLQLTSLKNLKRLFLQQTAVTDAGLQHLAHLPSLEELDLSQSRVTGEGFQYLADLPQLRWVGTSGLPISDKDLILLSQLPTFSGSQYNSAGHLDLSSSKVTSKGLWLLRDRNYAWADLSSLPLADKDLQVVETWKNLYTLNLSGTHVTGDNLSLSSNTNLQTLRLDGTKISDDGLASLQLPPTVVALSLSHTAITGETLTTLSGLRLSTLELAGTPLSPQGLANALALDCSTLDLSNVALTESLPATNGNRLTNIILNGESPMTKTLPGGPIGMQLRSLTLHDATEQHLDVPFRLPMLQFLTLIDGTFARDSFQVLSDHPSLQNLKLVNCRLNSDAITEIGRMKSLEVLYVQTSEKKATGFEVLKGNNPSLKIYYLDMREGLW